MCDEFNIVPAPFGPEPRLSRLISDDAVVHPSPTFDFLIAEATKIRLFLGPDFNVVMPFNQAVMEVDTWILSKTIFVPFAEYSPTLFVGRGYRRSEIPAFCKLKHSVAHLKSNRAEWTLARHYSSESLEPSQVFRGGENFLRVGHEGFFESWSIRDGCVERSDAHQRAVQIVESFFGEDSGDFSSNATRFCVFVDDQTLIGFIHRLQDGFFVQRH